MRDRTIVPVLGVLAVVAVAAACGDNAGAPSGGLAADCNPLGGQGCLLPWPSMAYLRADAAAPSGYRLDLPAGGMPVNSEGAPIDPAPLARWDGFSPTGPILAMFPRGVSPDGLPSFKTPDDSLAPGSPIVLYDLDRGERAPFFRRGRPEHRRGRAPRAGDPAARAAARAHALRGRDPPAARRPATVRPVPATDTDPGPSHRIFAICRRTAGGGSAI